MKWISFFIVIASLVACASKEPDALVEKKVQEQQTVKVVESGDTTKLEMAINQNAKLSTTEKKELLNVVHSYNDKNQDLLSERQKYRKVLLNEMLYGQDKAQVEILKKKIAEVEKKRTENFLSGVDQFESVLKDSKAKEEMMTRAMEMDANVLSTRMR